MVSAPAEVERDFRKNGYVVVPSLLDRERVFELRARAEDFLADDYARPKPHASYLQKAFTRTGELRSAKLSRLLDRDPAFDDVLSSDPFVDVVELLLGAGARRIHDGFVVKRAHTGGELSSHQDSAYWGVEPMSLVSAWVPLGDVNERRSPLTIAPAKHGSLVEHCTFCADGGSCHAQSPEDRTARASRSNGCQSAGSSW